MSELGYILEGLFSGICFIGLWSIVYKIRKKRREQRQANKKINDNTGV